MYLWSYDGHCLKLINLDYISASWKLNQPIRFADCSTLVQLYFVDLNEKQFILKIG